ncbi:MAG: TetR/AcrR family transcriptional regulator [Oleiphilaceae bacterium]|nr:TetR/AcrR family transcriptional regulator [Oleiphilaceae bacterium]
MAAAPTPTMTKKQIEFAKRENEILAAALSLFEGPYWEQVTVEQIARKADIGKGTVYKHFTCKEEIYAHITLRFTNRLLEAFKSSVSATEVLESLQNIIRLAFKYFIENPAEARVSFYCKREDYRKRLNDDLVSQFEALDAAFDHFVGGILQAGIDQGLFPDRPVEHLMMGLEATFDGAISMIWNGDISCQHVEDQETYVKIISEYMLAGLAGLPR